MENNRLRTEEREINLLDLLEKILYAWRGVLVLAIIFAILLPVMQYVRADKAYKAALNTTAEEHLEELEIELSQVELEKIEYAKESRRQILAQLEEKQQYMEDSVLMKLNPHHKPVVTMRYYIDTRYVMNYTKDMPKDYTNELMEAYVGYVKGGITQKLENQSDTSVKYMEELLSAGAGSNSVLTVSVIGEDQESAENLAAKVDEELRNYQSELEDKIGSHDFTQISSYFAYDSDQELADLQNQTKLSILDMNSRIVNLTAGFTEDMLTVWEGKTVREIEEDDDEMEDEIKVEPVPPSISAKYIVLGFLVGAFLYCAWIACLYILNGRMKTTDELQEIYGLRVFGKLSQGKDTSEKKKFLSGVDSLIDKALKKETWTLEEQKELILTNVAVSCRKTGVKNVFVTTSLHLSERDQKVLQQILDPLKGNGLQITFSENIMRNARAFEQMADIANVILVEKTGMTSYAALDQELILCMEQKANVLGAIGLE